MSNNTVPVLAAVVLGALALSPVFIKSFGNDPQVAAIGSRQLAGNSRRLAPCYQCIAQRSARCCQGRGPARETTPCNSFR